MTTKVQIINNRNCLKKYTKFKEKMFIRTNIPQYITMSRDHGILILYSNF